MESGLLKILIAEDESAHADAIQRAFREAGAEAAFRVADSLAVFRRIARDWLPDIALMDMNLSDGRAHDFLIAPPEDGPFPIVIMTSHGNEHIAVEAIKAGALDYIVKSSEGFSAMPRTLERALREWKSLQDRKDAVTALQKSERFVKNILASVDEAFVVVDRDYGILSANRAYCEQAGMPQESILGRRCYEISHHADRPCHECGLECGFKHTFATGDPSLVVHSYTHENGRKLQVEIRTSAIREASGEINSIIEIINDVTEKTELENQLRHAQKMESIGTLAGGIAHDFNNIMTAIIGYGNVSLMKMPKDDPARLNIERMLASANRAAALTQNLLAFSRKQTLDRKPVELNTVIVRVESLLERVIGEDIAVRVAPSVNGATIFADAGQLEQVFMNLATNARDAMPLGGSFLIECSTVELDSSFIRDHGYGKSGTYSIISATDTGEGMTENIQRKIFEPFFTTKEVGKGTGLGLSMVYGIIKQHEGFITVQSEPGKGTTFRIYLPQITAREQKVQNARDVSYAKGGAETILVAEDDSDVMKFTVLVLEQMGYTVIMAHDGEQAVEKFRENKGEIQLLLFDVVMPKKNGKEAYEEIRAMKPGVPVLFASGYSRDTLRQKGLLEGGEAIVFKPVSPQELLKKVRAALEGN